MCVFCDIVSGNVPAEVVYSDDQVLAFLDIRPLFPGHTLVVPRKHYQTLVDVPAVELGPFFAVVQRLASAVRAALNSHGTFVAMNNIVSQSVPHLHVHVVPRRFKDGLRGFFWPRTTYEDGDHIRTVREAIRAKLEEGA